MKEKKRKLKPTRKMRFRRRRKQKTDYKRRLTLLKSGMPRLVVRKSLKYIRAQIIEYDEYGDKTIVTATSTTLPGMGWQFACDNTSAAYLTGLLIGRDAKKKKMGKAVLDVGLQSPTKGSRIYAVVKGATDAGLDVPCDPKMLPNEERISGKHIAAHNEKFKELPQQVEKIKQKILGGKGKEIKGEKNAKKES
jgi:large subunit ribosomal protein L18